MEDRRNIEPVGSLYLLELLQLVETNFEYWRNLALGIYVNQ